MTYVSFISKIKQNEVLFFICSKCNNVGNTSYIKNGFNIENDFKQKTITCKCCKDGTSNTEVPTDDDRYIAAFSDYGFISIFDQIPIEMVVPSENNRYGVKLGKIDNLDDLDIVEASTNVSSGVMEFLDSVKDDLDKELNDKYSFDNVKKLEFKLKYADAKRNYKKYKKLNDIKRIEIYKRLMDRYKI